MDTGEQYKLEEMKAARSRIDQEISTMNNFEIVSVAAMGAIYCCGMPAEIDSDPQLPVRFKEHRI